MKVLFNRRAAMTHKDLTIIEVLKDPLIRLLMRADGVSVKTMKTLLVDAARRQGAKLGSRTQEHVLKSFAGKAHPVEYPRPGANDARASF
jgi:hypothetical protein